MPRSGSPDNAGASRIGGWRLAGSPSPYLQMHADNPVDWHPWGEEAFARARAENKPIFLSAGYSTCYWCHVMERESFRDREVARALNDGFVSIKLDREARPDVDELYMGAVMMMQGHGGWPMSVFLTPALKPFFAGTYYPRGDFLRLLQAVTAAWRNERDALERQANAVLRSLTAMHTAAAPGEPPPLACVDAAVVQLGARYDGDYGGFDAAPKFPMPVHLELLLERAAAGKDADGGLLAMATHTLSRMAHGGIHDQLGLGFHRYSTDAQWVVPHFEKMLYDNAQLLRVYAQAWRLAPDPVFEHTAEGVVALLDSELSAPDGTWYTALDAETEGEEGRYYVWTRAELRAALDEADWALAERAWGLDRAPNFEGGRYVLAWPADAQAAAAALGIDVGALLARLDGVRSRLRAARARRPAPHVDRKVLVGWNGLTVDALASAGVILQRPRWVEAAGNAAAVLWDKAGGAAGLCHMLRDGRPHGTALLEDYAGLLLGYTALSRACGEPRLEEQSAALADAMIDRFWDARAGGFFDAPAGAGDLLVRPRARFDGAIPSGNSLAARGLLRLVAGGRTRFLSYVRGTLAAFAQDLRQQPAGLTGLVRVLALYHAQGLAAAAPAVADSASKVEAQLLREGAGYALRLRVAPGWHLNAHPASDPLLLATELRAERGGGALALEVGYPPGRPFDRARGQPAVQVYAGELSIPLRARDGTLAGATLVLRLQACDEHGTCLAPAELRLAAG